MKTKLFLLPSNCLPALLATLGWQLISAPASSAADVFPVKVDAVSVSTNQDGNLAYHFLNDWTLIQDVAGEQGITNLAGLSLVYDLQADAIEVVSGTNDTVVATPLTFAGGVSLNNTNDTKVQRLAFVYWETNQVASGTLVAGESIEHGDTNQITCFNLAGQLQFALPDQGTNGPTIYWGSIRASEFRPFSREGRDGWERD